jgi:hypothetical protein
MNRTWLMLMLLVASVIFAACGGDSAPTDSPTTQDDPAARAVEAYLNAKVAADRDAMIRLICSAREGEIDVTEMSFMGTQAVTEGMACSSNEDRTVVTCEGNIVASYGGESRTMPLTSYQVVEEDGQWRWCGQN